MQTLHSHNISYLDLAVWSNLQIVRWQCYLTHSLHRRSRRQAHNHLALDNSRHPPHSRPRSCLGLRIWERFILPTIKSWPWSWSGPSFKIGWFPFFRLPPRCEMRGWKVTQMPLNEEFPCAIAFIHTGLPLLKRIIAFATNWLDFKKT